MSDSGTTNGVTEEVNSNGSPKLAPRQNGAGSLTERGKWIGTVKAISRTFIITGFVVSAVAGSIWAFSQFKEHLDLEIIASIEPQGTSNLTDSNALTIVGRVLYQGEPVTNARVWCIARDVAGNRFLQTNWAVDGREIFRLEGIPEALRTNSEIRVFAKASVKSSGSRTPLRGEAVIMTKGIERQANIMDSKLWPCTLAFFCISIFVGLAIHVVDPEWRRQLYIASVITALALTAGMLLGIAEAYMKVKTSVTPGQTWSVGFISIFEGTYVKTLPDQWLLSLTGPPHDGTPSTATAQSGEPIQGLGAPMWVIFLAVIGAALHTVALIVNEIKLPPCFSTNDPVDLRERMLNLVQNQFFMLFAPLGGIFIYQGLVLAGAAAQPFVVALAAMGAGATLNVVLSLAVSKASDVLLGSQKNVTAGSGESTRGTVPDRNAISLKSVSQAPAIRS
jgi:hypothetical protein